MDARTLSTLQSAGRFVIGLGYLLAPAVTGPPWIGADADRPGTQVFTSAFGARDLAIGLGQGMATRQGFGVKAWLRAGFIADAADLVATLRAREHVPATAVAGVTVIAGGSLVLGAWLSTQLD